MGVAAWAAGDGSTGSGGASGVDGAEAGSGESGEHGGVSGDGGGDAFAPGEARLDDLVGIAPQRDGAGWAYRGSPVAAALVDHTIGHRLGVCSREAFPGHRVDGHDVAGKPDGPSAAGGRLNVVQP